MLNENASGLDTAIADTVSHTPDQASKRTALGSSPAAPDDQLLVDTLRRWRELMAECDAVDADELDEINSKENEFESLINATPASSMVGLRAKAEFLRELADADLVVDLDAIGRTTVSLIDSVLRLAEPVRSEALPDPVFALIEAEQAIWDRFVSDGDDSNEAGDLAVDALSAAMACQPTTAAGAVASLKLCLARLGDDWIGHPDVEAVFGSVIGFLDGTNPAVSQAADPVLGLLAKEAELHQAANAALKRDPHFQPKGECDRAVDRQNAAQDATMATRPTTVEGFAAVLERWHERHGRVSEQDGLPYHQIMSLIRAGKGEPAPQDRAPEPVAFLQAAE